MLNNLESDKDARAFIIINAKVAIVSIVVDGVEQSDPLGLGLGLANTKVSFVVERNCA